MFRVLEVNTVLSASLRLDEVVGDLMEKAKIVCYAEASSLMLVDEETQQLYFYTISGEKDQDEHLKSIRLNMGEGIAGWVAQNKQPVLIKDCTKDKRFYRKADEETKFKTLSMACVPLLVKERCIGVVQVLNRLDRLPFDETDLRIFQFLANQAAIAIENARLHETATVDKMTNLYRKDFFLARLEDEFQKAQRENTPLSLVMSDIDFFKKVNDTYGHGGGDAALVSLARIIRATVQNTSSNYVAGRYGGEEFCVLMPGADKHKAIEAGELIRKNVEGRTITIGECQVNITISIGIATYPLHKERIENPEDFIKIADEALYLCKNKGRNCVSVYTDKNP